MNNNLNTLWCLTANNLYSYDSGEERKVIYLNEDAALNAFNSLLKDYYEEEISMAKELFEKDINSFEDILKEVESINNDGSSQIKAIEYKYGLEISDKYKRCSIYRFKKELSWSGYHSTTEEVHIALEKIEPNIVSTSFQTLLDNYKDLENYIKNN